MPCDACPGLSVHGKTDAARTHDAHDSFPIPANVPIPAKPASQPTTCANVMCQWRWPRPSEWATRRGPASKPTTMSMLAKGSLLAQKTTLPLPPTMISHFALYATILAGIASADRLETHTCESNPCLSASEGSYFAHSDRTRYIVCGAEHNGGRLCYEMPCGAGTVWNQEAVACVQMVSLAGEDESEGAVVVSSIADELDLKKLDEETLKGEGGKTYTCESNPCLSASEGSYFAHSDHTKYIQCGAEHNGGRLCYEMPCGAGTVWNQGVIACVHDCDGGCGNPCGNVARDGYYHPHCNNDNIHQFIQCDNFGGCFVQDCAPGTVWSQAFLTCVSDCSSILGGPNPCPDALARGFSAVGYEGDKNKYIQCDANSGCYLQPCGEDMIWSDEVGHCIDDPSRVIVKPDSGGFVKTCENDRVYSHDFAACIKPCRGLELDANPCTYDAVMNDRMFHPHPEKKLKYIECWPNGACNVIDCPEGTKYSQYREMCVDMEFDCGGEANMIMSDMFDDESEGDEGNGGITGEDARRQLRSVSKPKKRRLRSKSSSSGNKTHAEDVNRVWQKGCEDVYVDRANKSKSRKSKGSKGGSRGKGRSGKGGKGGSGKGKSGSSSR